MKDSLIVVSGGMDSITLLYECADRIALAVSFDYGANHNHKEIPFARIHCERLKIKHIVKNISEVRCWTVATLYRRDIMPMKI